MRPRFLIKLIIKSILSNCRAC